MFQFVKDCQGSQSLPIHCIIEQTSGYLSFETSLDDTPTYNTAEVEGYVILPRTTLISQCVRAVLHSLGYNTTAIKQAKGTIQLGNWKRLDIDSITESQSATIDDILKGLTRVATLRIRICRSEEVYTEMVERLPSQQAVIGYCLTNQQIPDVEHDNSDLQNDVTVGMPFSSSSVLFTHRPGGLDRPLPYGDVEMSEDISIDRIKVEEDRGYALPSIDSFVMKSTDEPMDLSIGKRAREDDDELSEPPGYTDGHVLEHVSPVSSDDNKMTSLRDPCLISPRGVNFGGKTVHYFPLNTQRSPQQTHPMNQQQHSSQQTPPVSSPGQCQGNYFSHRSTHTRLFTEPYSEIPQYIDDTHFSLCMIDAYNEELNSLEHRTEWPKMEPIYEML